MTPSRYSASAFHPSVPPRAGSCTLENVPPRVDQSRMSNELPSAGTKPPASETCSAPPSVAVPADAIVSYWLPALPSSLICVCDPFCSDNDPTCRTAGVAPVERVPPLATVTAPPIVPGPCSVALALTVTLPVIAPVTERTPAFTVVPPDHVFAL